MSARARLSRLSPYLLAALLAAAASTHFLRPEPYDRIVPRVLPLPRAWTIGSGLLELACAAGLLVRRTRRRAAWLTAGLFVVVFPANVQMALDGGLEGEEGLLGSPVVAWLRLPLQVPLVLWAVAVARRAPR